MQMSSSLHQIRPGIDRPFTGPECRLLELVGLPTQDPGSVADFDSKNDIDLNAIILAFLDEYAGVKIKPASTDSMTGAGTQAVNDIIGSGQTAARQYMGRNQKIAAQSLEWLHWKQWALSNEKFEAYKQDQFAKAQKERSSYRDYLVSVRPRISDFLLSQEGKSLVEYEVFPGRGTGIVIIIFACMVIPYVFIPYLIVSSKRLWAKRGITVNERLMEKLFNKPRLSLGRFKYNGQYCDRQKTIQWLVLGGPTPS